MIFPTQFLSNMSRREKILATAIGALLLLLAGSRGYAAYRQAVELRRDALISAEQTLSKARVAVQRGQRARHRLLAWRKKSLPANHDIARSLYQDWLQQELSQASVQVEQLRDTTASGSRSRDELAPQFRLFTFSVHAQGTLASLVRFLYRFYMAPHLHRIASASLKPTADRKELDIKLAIEAIAVPGCRRTDQLAANEARSGQARTGENVGENAKKNIAGPDKGSEKGEPGKDGLSADLENRQLEQVLKAIQSRNVFAVYQPHQSPAGQATVPAEDAAQQTRVSGLTYGGGGWRLALRRQDTGRTRYFRLGDHIHIGQIEGRIASMDGRQVVIDTAAGKRAVRLGQSLLEGTVVP